jgi:N-acetylglucosaminyldiphosphoundecaprenol N-acetyl-beta-D-mannosaminyltransferase
MERDEARVSICGIPIDNFSDLSAAIEEIESRCLQSGGPLLQVNFVNAHVVNIAMARPEVLAILQGGDLNLADGLGVWLGGKILAGADLKNMNGTDLGLRVLEWGAAKGLKFYFLGARNGIADIAKERLRARIPGLLVVGSHNGYIAPEEAESVAEGIRESGAEILFVCMGVPNQELWIHGHRSSLGDVRAAFGLGAFFDFYSDSVKRAPPWIIKARAEWVYRLFQEPRRLWKRYLLGNFIYIGHILKCKRQDAHQNCR